MPRKLLLSLLALVLVAPVVAQVAPIRIPVMRPVTVEPLPAPVAVEPIAPIAVAPSEAPTFDVTNDPEKARALINKLKAEKRALREAMTVTLGDLQNARTTIDEMTRLGGSLVRAQCVSETLSRNTAGASENCAASGYLCGGVEGTCMRQCTSSTQCAGGFVCDTGAARCVVPAVSDVE